ncbi:MAG TPA: RNB domain-containing ribonuclease, partial [Thermoanaerobaculia bacterium]
MTIQRDPRHCNQHEMLDELAHQAMIDRGLEPDFPDSAMKQLAGITKSAGSDAGIRDMRDLLWCSIDNDDSRDLDQLTVAEDLGNGTVRALVAVADVDGLVKKGTPIDDHARHNTTSVYTAARIFPMLPEKLSTDLTSLVQDQERLSLVIEMTVTDAGAVAQSDIYRAVVVNRAKLAYRGVATWLEGAGPAPAAVTAVLGMDQQLRLQDRIAQTLKRT